MGARAREDQGRQEGEAGEEVTASAEHDDVARAARAIQGAGALLVTAGAGMGVDSGLPDFRGPEGFWRAYPPYQRLGLAFEDLASSHWFDRDPALAWGFYGHRLNLYRETTPHAGFGILRRWADRAARGAFTFTSNVDGHFQAAGFPEDRVHECHGAIRTLQCMRDCGLFPAGDLTVFVDEATFRARPPFPACPTCGALARPNILMFSDSGWDSARSDAQADRLQTWLDDVSAANRSPDRPALVVVEMGAGTAIPTVRRVSERAAHRADGLLVRINVREPRVPDGHVGLALGARDALVAIDAALSST